MLNGMKAKLAPLIIGAALLAGCAGVRAHRGAVIDPQLASAIQVGVDNQDSVTKTLGRPTFVSQFNPNEWYYVSRDTSGLAFRNEHVTKQTVLRVTFDKAGNVAFIDHSDKRLVAAVDPVSVRTPTVGRKRSLFDELFGGIGTIGSGGSTGGPGQ